MKLSGLGPRTTKLYARNVVIAAVMVIIWLGVYQFACELGFKKYAFWVGIPFFLVAFLAGLGFIGIGPLKRGFYEAVIDDEKEEKKKYISKQPWEK